MTAELTLGAEEELHLIDRATMKLSAQAPQLLSKLPDADYTAEIQRTTVETNTQVVTTLSGLREELIRLRRGILDVAEPAGIAIAAVGTAPRSEFADFELTTTGRYGRMQEQYRMLVDEQLICGTQIHVGVADRDLAVEISQRVAYALPILLALSASSPYWNGNDTGYASIRSIIWQRWPSAGSTGPLQDAAEYDELLSDLIQSGVIADSKMAYFEVRPSSHAPTLELRVCDACPIIDDAVLIAGLFRAAVRAAECDVAAGRPRDVRPAPLHRAAMWQAARGGLSGMLLDDSRHPRPIPAAQAVRALLERLRPDLEALGDYPDIHDLLEAVLARGNSADRQRAAFAEAGRLDDVMDLVIEETHGPPQGPAPVMPELRTYASRAGDEAVGLGSRPRPAYRDILDFYQRLDANDLAERMRRRDEWTDQAGMTFTVDGTPRRFEVDLIPRVISKHEWAALDAGLTQRARAIECFLQDVYSDARIVEDGIIPAEVLAASPGWRDEAARLPRDTIRAPVLGFDVVRNELGGWRVLEDNARTPSGIAYAIAARDILDATVPDLPRPAGLRDPKSAFAQLRQTLLARCGADGVGALLSDGPSSAGWYEHRSIAEGAGLLLVQPGQLEVRDGVVLERATGRRVDALYLRLDEELLDVTGDGDRIGAAILEVAAAGGVVLANAPGNGVADDKATYCFVPELIGYYLGEHPLLESVPTYRTSDASERRIVLERVGELVTKPVDGYGGRGVLIGPASSAQEVAERRLEIARNPAAWVAQEMVALSSLPAFSDARLEPRLVDLRAFVYLTGTGADQARLVGAALTRVARHGALIVNSSQGGGAKDTWVLGVDGQ